MQGIRYGPTGDGLRSYGFDDPNGHAGCLPVYGHHFTGPLGDGLETESQIRARLAELEAEHRALDSAIGVMHEQAAPDIFAIQRLKKRKLQLKDSIQRLRSRLIPDLNA